MNKSTRKTLTAAACACFAVHAGTQLFNALRYGALGQLPNAVVYLLLIAGLLLRNGPFLAAGGALALVMGIPGVIATIGYYPMMHNAVVILTGLLGVLAGLFLLLLGLNKRRCVIFGYVAAALDLLSVLLTYLGWRIPGLGGLQQPIRPFRLTLPMLWIAGVILTGYLRREMPTAGETWKALTGGERNRAEK